MSDKKKVELDGEVVIAKAKDFWTRNSKAIIGVCAAIILVAGGWLVYKKFFKEPKETKAIEAMFKAEEYFRMDSVKLALNGDGQHMGFLKVISKFGGTEAADLASFYAGSCYIKLDDNVNAVKYLKDFSTSSKPVQARAYKLLGDAYGDQGKNSDALSNYKKAARHFEEDKASSSDALFSAAEIAERMKDTKEAIALYKELKDKFPGYSSLADLRLAMLGVYNAN